MRLGIKFRPNKPASPHLNGKVERSQRTDLEEFYALKDLSDFNQLQEELSLWQFFTTGIVRMAPLTENHHVISFMNYLIKRRFGKKFIIITTLKMGISKILFINKKWQLEN